MRAEQGSPPAPSPSAVITQGIREKIERDSPSRSPRAAPDVRRVEYVGPAVGRELRNQGVKAVLYAMALIVVYIGLRFDFRFSPGVIIALLHDAIVTLGYFAFTGREFNLTSIAVILTIVGYSVNDTVVIYDRVRENQAKFKGRSLGEIVNLSINETLGRPSPRSRRRSRSSGCSCTASARSSTSPPPCSSASSRARTRRGSSPRL